MRLYLNERPRTFIFTSGDNALIIRHPLPQYKDHTHHHHILSGSSNLSRLNPLGDSNPSKIFVEFTSKESLLFDGFVDITPGKNSHDSHKGLHGLLGFVNVKNDVFIGFITEHNKVATPRLGEDVHVITNVEFFCLNTDRYDPLVDSGNGVYNASMASSTSSIQSQQLNHHSFHFLMDKESAANPIGQTDFPAHSIRKLLSLGSFFYSKNFDITSTVQERFNIRTDDDGMMPYKFTADSPYFKRFMWNHFLISELFKLRDSLAQHEKNSFDTSGFLTPIARGYAQTLNTNVEGDQEALLTLISKQLCLKNGPLFGDWGCDEDGEVSNFVESEVIVYSERFCCAYVIVRGNVPIFWELELLKLSRSNRSIISGKKHKKILYPRSFEASQYAMEKHFETLQSQYGEVHVVNSLKQDESTYKGDLNRIFKQHISNYNSSNNSDTNENSAVGSSHLRMTDIPLSKAAIRKIGYNSTNPLDIVNRLQHAILDLGAFYFDYDKGLLTGKQLGVFRIDSFDSLGKANFISKVIAQEVIIFALRDVGIAYGHSLLATHGKLWTANNEKLKELTNNFQSTSLKLQSSRSSSTKHSIKSHISKKYLSAVVEQRPNETAVLKLLGKLQDQSLVLIYTPIHQRLTQELRGRLNEYSSPKEILIFASTFNVNGNVANESIHEWLFPKSKTGDEDMKQSYDIVFVGLQEVVELTPGHMVNTELKNRLKWIEKIKGVLESHQEIETGVKHKYVSLWDGQLGGIAMLFFVNELLTSKVRGLEASFRKTGLGGMSANKGGIAIRFNFSDTLFCFIVSHLAAGLSNVDERHQNYKTLVKGFKFSRNRKMKDHDAVIWLGDFNYRIGLANEQVRPLVEKQDYSKLLEYDQLNSQMSSGASFPFFDEMEIKFAPTYKFDNGTDNYDTSEKQRIPAWTDRILSQSRGKILKQLEYGSAPSIKFSDHRPVYSVFNAMVRVVDEQKKKSVYDSLIEQSKKDYGSIQNLFFANNDISFLLEDNESSLPPPSSDTSKWWLLGGKPAKVSIPLLNGQAADGDTMVINPFYPINPFETTNEPEFLEKLIVLNKVKKELPPVK